MLFFSFYLKKESRVSEPIMITDLNGLNTATVASLLLTLYYYKDQTISLTYVFKYVSFCLCTNSFCHISAFRKSFCTFTNRISNFN